METYKVGGCVRDEILGRRVHDVDVTVVMPGTFPDVVAAVRAFTGSEPYKVDPRTFTIRTRVPEGFMGVTHPDLDFVWARKESAECLPGTRVPAHVESGTLRDDLDRRDFRMNAIAVDADGIMHDPHNGIADIGNKVIDTVGDPYVRFMDDGLRVMRAVRFAVTLGFTISPRTFNAIRDIRDTWRTEGRAVVSNDRVRDELNKALAVDVMATVRLIDRLGLGPSVFRDGLWLKATTETPK